VDLTKTAIGFATVAFETEQLNVRPITAAAAGIRLDVIVFQVGGAAATLTPSTIPGIDDLFGGGRNVPALSRPEQSK
jgi:hypothetical protein